MYLKEELQHLTAVWKEEDSLAEERSVEALLDQLGLERNDHAVKKAKEDYRFEMVVGQIAERAREAARRGERSLVVYEFNEDEQARPGILPCGTDRSFCTADMLIGVAKRVYAHCRTHHLMPKIAYIRDCHRETGHWQIHIYW